MAKRYSWIKVGAKCKWNDPAITDYPKNKRKEIQNINKEISIVVAKTNKDSCYIDDDVNNKIFTNELLEELECFIEEDTWNGSSYLTEDALYRAALEELKEMYNTREIEK